VRLCAASIAIIDIISNSIFLLLRKKLSSLVVYLARKSEQVFLFCFKHLWMLVLLLGIFLTTLEQERSWAYGIWQGYAKTFLHECKKL
jgi:hypothetical protein